MSRLLLVYNADSGYFNGVADALHKMLSPATYSCNLCFVTFGTFKMKSEWRRFIESLSIPVEFLHRDEFLARYRRPDIKLPAMLWTGDDEELSILADSEAIERARTVSDMKRLVSQHLPA